MIFAASFLCAQNNNENNVINGSFETMGKKKKVCGRGEFEKADYISSANNTTVDLYSKNSGGREVGVPENYMGMQDSYTGDNYAGIIAYYGDERGIFKTKPGYQRYSEYIQLELAKPLEAGRSYQVSFKAALAEKSAYAVSGLGVYFSAEKLDVKNNAYLEVIPHMVTPEVVNRTDWETVSGTYVASGGERFITLGCFDDFMDTVKVIPAFTNNSRKAYYYIDDVSMSPDTSRAPGTDIYSVLFGSCFQLEHLNFELDKAVILPESYEELNMMASFLKTYPFLVVYLEGHTDKTGSEEHNDKLSVDRAIAVKDYLVNRGVASDRLKTRGFGERVPIDTQNENSMVNRRVETTICPIAVTR